MMRVDGVCAESLCCLPTMAQPSLTEALAKFASGCIADPADWLMQRARRKTFARATSLKRPPERVRARDTLGTMRRACARTPTQSPSISTIRGQLYPE